MKKRADTEAGEERVVCLSNRQHLQSCMKMCIRCRIFSPPSVRLLRQLSHRFRARLLLQPGLKLQNCAVLSMPSNDVASASCYSIRSGIRDASSGCSSRGRSSSSRVIPSSAAAATSTSAADFSVAPSMFDMTFELPCTTH